VSERPVAVAVSGRGLVDPAAAVIAVDDEGFTRGRAAFETLRVYAGRPFRLEQHLDRLDASAERLGFAAPGRAHVAGLVQLVLDAAGPADAVLRLFATPGPPGAAPIFAAVVAELPVWIEEARARGQRLVSLTFPRRSAPWLLPGTKSVSYATHVAAEAEARRRGADDALLVDHDGTVLEGTVTNVWWREGAKLLTPSLDLGILAGETRAALLELAPECGYDVDVGELRLERLRRADEIFTSSSVREVMPVVELDGRRLDRGPAAVALQQALRRAATADERGGTVD
jgi:branched-subunit amino acid aminotransferase/4-amino-4-deoxychorismate lyase